MELPFIAYRTPFELVGILYHDEMAPQRPPENPTDETESSSLLPGPLPAFATSSASRYRWPPDPGLLTWLEGRRAYHCREMTAAVCKLVTVVYRGRRWLFPKVVSQPDVGKHDREVAKRVNGLTWRASERARLARLIYHCLVWPPSGRLIAIGANIIIFPEFPRPITDFASSRATLLCRR